jgi:hypothetical protein
MGPETKIETPLVPRSEISFIQKSKQKYICLPDLEKDNFRGHTPKSVSDPNPEFSGYTCGFPGCSFLPFFGFVYSLENKFVVSGPENDRLFIKNEN